MQQIPSTIKEAVEKMRSGIISARKLTEAFLDRISKTDDQIKAWVLVDAERARLEADAADRKVKMQMPLGPLHGIPIGVKDVIDVADWPTAAGSLRWRQSIAREDAPCVTSLRRAGAVILGKTVTTPFASFDPAPTFNPRYPGRTPGGSSAGSAASVAAGHCFASLGTQTGGSIIRPASYCGVAGYKPTFGAINKKGVVPLAQSLDHVGLIANCVNDLYEVAKCLHSNSPKQKKQKYGNRNILIDSGLNSCWVDVESCKKFNEIRSGITQFGVPQLDVNLPGEFYEILENHRVLMAAEAYEWHSDRWRRFPDDYPACISQLLSEGAAYDCRTVLRAQRYRTELKIILENWWPSGGFLMMPATPSPPPDRTSTGDPRCQSPWSFLGWPTLSIPVHSVSSILPFSLQLIGLPGSDNMLFELGLRIESALCDNLK